MPQELADLVGVAGSPISHSLSPVLHKAAFVALGLSWESERFEVGVGGGSALLDSFRTLGLRGLSITMPLKEEMASVVDRLDEAATRLGSVNCLAREGELVIGRSTDGRGLLDSLAFERSFDVSGARVVIIGAGGAARSVAAACGAAGASEVSIVARNQSAAQRAAELAGSVGRVGVATDAAVCDLVIESTPVGMAGTGEVDQRSLVDPALLHEGQLAVDLVYNPLRTPWLEAARAAGADTVGGLGMLVHQAALQIECWTGQTAPVDAMWDAVREVAASW